MNLRREPLMLAVLSVALVGCDAPKEDSVSTDFLAYVAHNSHPGFALRMVDTVPTQRGRGRVDQEVIFDLNVVNDVPSGPTTMGLQPPLHRGEVFRSGSVVLEYQRLKPGEWRLVKSYLKRAPVPPKPE